MSLAFAPPKHIFLAVIITREVLKGEGRLTDLAPKMSPDGSKSLLRLLIGRNGCYFCGGGVCHVPEYLRLIFWRESDLSGKLSYFSMHAQGWLIFGAAGGGDWGW